MPMPFQRLACELFGNAAAFTLATFSKNGSGCYSCFHAICFAWVGLVKFPSRRMGICSTQFPCGIKAAQSSS